MMYRHNSEDSTTGNHNLHVVTEEEVQRENYLGDKLARGLNILSGQEPLTTKELYKQIAALSFLFWRGADAYGIPAAQGNDLQRAREILCVMRLNGFPVDEKLIEEKVLPGVLNRTGKGCASPLKEVFKIRKDLLAFDELLVKHLNGSPTYSYEFTVSNFDAIRRARMTLLNDKADA